MSQTVDLLAKFDWNEDGHELSSVYKAREAQSISNVQVHKFALNSNTANYQVAFSSQFSTVKYGFIEETGGYTLTFSRSGTSTHQLINANGFVMWEGNTTSLYLTNNHTDAGEEPVVTVFLAG